MFLCLHVTNLHEKHEKQDLFSREGTHGDELAALPVLAGLREVT